MRIAVACDHIVTDRKNHVVEYLKEKGHEVIDCGTYNNERTHYAIYGKKAAEKVVGGQADLGVVLCGTGVGITASTAKVVGTRPTLVRDISSAVYARKHLNANILGFGGRITGVGLMENIIDAFLETKFEPTEADNKIIEKIDSIAVAKEAYAGDARSKYVEALNYANEGNFGEAEKLIEEASELINEAHKVQTNMIQMEAAGNKVDVSFLMVHAQDHLMTVMLLRDIVKNFVNLAKKIG